MEAATQADVDAALRPFMTNFVRKEKVERVVSLFLPMRKRATPRVLFDVVRSDAVLDLDSDRARVRIARLERDAAGVWLAGSKAFRTTFGQALRLADGRESDEEMFVATSGAFGLFTLDIGGGYLIVPP